MIADMSKLQEVVWKDFERLKQKLGTKRAWEVWDNNLKKIGIRPLFVRRYSEEASTFLVEDVILMSQKNSDCILVHAGEVRDGNNIYAIPRPLAEKILMLGGLPGIP